MARSKERDSFDISRKSVQLTARGTAALAIRRNIGNCAARDVGAMILENLSPQTVLRSEINTGAALVAVSRTFYHVMEGVMTFHREAVQASQGESSRLAIRHHGASRDLVVAAHGIRGDASNSTVLQNSKVRNQEIESMYLVRKPDFDGEPILSRVRRNRALADLQLVGDGTALGTYSLMSKQLASLGCPHWTTKHAGQPCLGSGIVLDVFAFTADQGPDEARLRKIITVQTMDTKSTIVFDYDCALHNGHIIDK